MRWFVGVYGVIYKITNKINGKVYIGQTTQPRGFKDRYCTKGKGIERVYNYMISRKRNNDNYNKHLFSSIVKYGFGNFCVDEVLDKAKSLDELNNKEKAYINKFKSYNPKYGYNDTLGGDNYERSDYAKSKYNKKYSKPVYCITNKRFYSSINEASKATGCGTGSISSCCLGKSHQSRGLNNRYYKFKYFSHIVSGNKIPVVCITTNKHYISLTEACDDTGISKRSIHNACKGISKYAGKTKSNKRMIWKFAKDIIYELHSK